MGTVTEGTLYVDRDLGTNDTNHGESEGSGACQTLAYCVGTKLVGPLTGAVTIYCKGTTADTASVTVSGHTTTASYDITIMTADSHENGHRHSGVYSTSHYRLETVNDGIDIVDDYVNIIGLQIKVTTTGTYRSCIACDHTAGNTAIANISKCILVQQLSGAADWGYGIRCVYKASGTFTVNLYNNVIYDIGAVGANNRAVDIYSPYTLNAYNNTVVDCTRGFVRASGTFKAVNNIVKGSGDENAYVGSFSDSGYNLTDGTDTGDGGGETSHQSVSAWSFNNESGNDFSLTASSTGVIGEGTNNPGSGLYSDDIIGVARSSGGPTWDPGAFEYVGAGGLSIPVAMHHYRQLERSY